jgi:hypothetical protein
MLLIPWCWEEESSDDWTYDDEEREYLVRQKGYMAACV